MAHKPAAEHLRIGPNGFYTIVDDVCYNLNVNTPGFEEVYPLMHATHVNVIAAVEKERQEKLRKGTTPQRVELVAEATPGCGQVCDQDCLWPCTCQYNSEWTDGQFTYIITTCQG